MLIKHKTQSIDSLNPENSLLLCSVCLNTGARWIAIMLRENYHLLDVLVILLNQKHKTLTLY